MPFDAWRMLAGLGLFLFAMGQLEAALRSFAGRGFRRWLAARTDGRWRAVGVGTLATALLQSSSLVGLMVLAFVAAGLMALENALGVVLGANLGTTATGWLVATLGFKLDLEDAALPLVGCGGLAFAILRGKWAEFGRFVTASGFLLLGLALMKSSVGDLAAGIDVARLGGQAPWRFLVLGTVVAAIVQSSSATVMLTLTALDAGLIPLPCAAAAAIGADLGTTSTILLGAVAGGPAKKRVAAGHFFFNLITDAAAFVGLGPLLGAIAALGISDPLLALVAFHSAFNLLGILCFLPFVGHFARLLERRFRRTADREGRYIADSAAGLSEAALSALAAECAHLIARALRLNMHVFSPRIPQPPGRAPVPFEGDEEDGRVGFDELYRRTKRLEGEIVSFALKVQAGPLTASESARLSQLLSATRQAVSSAKFLRDVRHDLREFEDSPRRVLNAYLDHFRSITTAFYGDVYRLGVAGDPQTLFSEFAALLGRARTLHDQMHKELYGDVQRGRIGEDEISSLLNVNRELLNSNTALIRALAEFHLGKEQADSLA